jgi:hypothetical protein
MFESKSHGKKCYKKKYIEIHIYLNINDENDDDSRRYINEIVFLKKN